MFGKYTLGDKINLISSKHPFKLSPATLIASMLILTSMSLMLRDLGKESFWYDEVWTYNTVAYGPTGIIQAAANDVHPPLYFLISHCWLNSLDYWLDFLGRSEAKLRSLSSVFGVSSLISIYVLGKRLFGERSVLMSLAFASFSPHMIKYSQEARPYSLFLFLTVISTYFLIRLYQEDMPSKLTRRGLSISCILLLYTHATAAFVILGYIFTILSAWKERYEFARVGVRCLFVAILAFIPWSYPTLLQTIKVYKGIQGPGIGFSFEFTNFRYILIDTLESYVGGGTLFVGLFIAFVAIGIIYMIKGEVVGRPCKILILSVLVFPHLLPGLFSLIGQPIYVERITIPSVSAFFLLAGYGLNSFIHKNRLKWARIPMSVMAIVIILTVQFWNLNVNYYAKVKKDDWRSVARDINQTGGLNDVILISAAHGWVPLKHYYKGNLKILGHSWDRLYDQDSFGTLMGNLCEHGRVWLILNHRNDWNNLRSNDIYNFLSNKGFKEIKRKQYHGINTVLFAIPGTDVISLNRSCPSKQMNKQVSSPGNMNQTSVLL